MDRQAAVNAIGYNVRVICGFPGIGKTRARSEKTCDMNMQGIPEHYQIDAIRAKIAEGYIVMVASWAYLRKRLHKAGIEYVVVYPSLKIKGPYMERLATRKGGTRSKHLQKMAHQYKNMVHSCMADPSPYHICLESIDENLADFL